MMCGMSMVNAAMTAQLMIDRFSPACLLMSGIAGSTDPALNIGDVVIPERWAQSLEVVMGREGPGGFAAPGWLTWKADLPGFGMMLPNQVMAGNAAAKPAPRLWFEADPGLFAIAEALDGVDLRDHRVPVPLRLVEIVPVERLVRDAFGVGDQVVDAVQRVGHDRLLETFSVGVSDLSSASLLSLRSQGSAQPITQ